MNVLTCTDMYPMATSDRFFPFASRCTAFFDPQGKSNVIELYSGHLVCCVYLMILHIQKLRLDQIDENLCYSMLLFQPSIAAYLSVIDSTSKT